jgi:rhamnogalacturonyl hydrolase YesR
MIAAALALAASLDLAGDVAAVAALPGEPHAVSAAALEGDHRLLTLENLSAFDTFQKGRLVLVGTAVDPPEDAAHVLEAVRWFKRGAPARLRARWTVSALPELSRDQTARIEAWTIFQAPDLIVQVGAAPSPLLQGDDESLVQHIVYDNTFFERLTALLEAPAGARPTIRSRLLARAGRDPIAIARILATRYPQQPSISYIPSVAWLGMLGLTAITHERDWRDKVVEQTRPWVSGEKPLFGRQTPLTAISGAMIFAEMKDVDRSAALMKEPAQLAAALKDDGTYANGRGWTDDMFMATAVLVRTGQLDLAARKLVDYAARLQRPDGLFIHGTDGPWAWGRGNGFAALGLAEALAAMPANHPDRKKLLDIFRRHMAALVKAQAPDGMWNEVVDEPGSYRELTATAMIFTAMHRAIRFGWIDPSHTVVADRAWRAIAAHVADDGSLIDVCESTGAGPTKTYYLNRKAINGPDDRGGAMALMAAVEKHAAR